MILQQFYYTEYLIYECTMNKSGSLPADPAFRRYEVYQSCLNSIKGWLDTFFSAPVAISIGTPLIHHPQFSHLMRGLHMLSTLDDPAWDRNAMQKTLDLGLTCDRLIEVWKSLAPVSPNSSESREEEEEEDDVFSFGIMLFENLKAKWQSEIANIGRTSTPGRDVGFSDGMQNETLTFPTNFFGNTWLDEIWNTTW